MIWPTASGRQHVALGRRYGADRGDHRHRGIDLDGPGDAVYAAAAGTVRQIATDDGGGGLWVAIAHGDGWETRYMHLANVTVGPGQYVACGDTIGTVGRSGIRYSRAQLHFETHHHGQAVDPLPLLEGHALPGGSPALAIVGFTVGVAILVGVLT